MSKITPPTSRPYDPYWPFDAGRSAFTRGGHAIGKVGCTDCAGARQDALLENRDMPECSICSGRGWTVAVIVPRNWARSGGTIPLPQKRGRS